MVIFCKDSDLAKRFAVSRCTIWRWVKSAGLPPPVKLSTRCTRWKKSEVDEWEASLSKGSAEL